MVFVWRGGVTCYTEFYCLDSFFRILRDRIKQSGVKKLSRPIFGSTWFVCLAFFWRSALREASYRSMYLGFFFAENDMKWLTAEIPIYGHQQLTSYDPKQPSKWVTAGCLGGERNGNACLQTRTHHRTPIDLFAHSVHTVFDIVSSDVPWFSCPLCTQMWGRIWNRWPHWLWL